MVLMDLQFMTNNFMIQDDSDFYGFSLVCGVVTLMLIVCVLLVHWQIYNESINHLSLVAVWCRGLWSDVGDKTRRPRPHLGHSPWSPESESHHLTRESEHENRHKPFRMTSWLVLFPPTIASSGAKVCLEISLSSSCSSDLYSDGNQSNIAFRNKICITWP